MLADDRPDLVEPPAAILGGAHDDRLEVAAEEILDAAEAEDARFPEVFQRVAEEPQFVVARGIGCREDHGSAAGDQKRFLTPAEARSKGADVLVIGRPITAAADPAEAAGRIRSELEA